MEPQNFLALMPLEILTKIFSFLPRRERFICTCMDERWKQAMNVPSLWKHMCVRLDVDFFEVSTIQLTLEYCKYIKSLELRFEYPEEPMQWINYTMMNITKRLYRFLSIFVNRNLQIYRLVFNNFCDFYRSKKILYYLSMFLKRQFNLKVLSFNGSYFSKKALIKILTSSFATNHETIEYVDIQNSYYEHEFHVTPFNILATQLMTCLASISNLVVLKLDFESLISNNILEGFQNGKCNTLEYLDIFIAEHDLSNSTPYPRMYSNAIWINLRRKFAKLKVSITFYELSNANEALEKILCKSIPVYSMSWCNNVFNALMKSLYEVTLKKYAATLEILKIQVKVDTLDDLITHALRHCPALGCLEIFGVVTDVDNLEKILRLEKFEGSFQIKKWEKITVSSSARFRFEEPLVVREEFGEAFGPDASEGENFPSEPIPRQIL